MVKTYVVLRFNLVAVPDGAEKNVVPVFEGAGIYGEFPLTRGPERRLSPMFKILEAEGNNYEESVQNALAKVKESPLWSWLLPHLLRGQGFGT